MTISPSSIHRGIAICSGMEVVSPVDEDESSSIDFCSYVQTCQTELESRDLVYVHVPIPYRDRSTEIQSSIEAVEQFDEQVVGPLMQSMDAKYDCRLLVVANRPDEDDQDSPDVPIPYVMVTNSEAQSVVSGATFNEVYAMNGVPRDATRIVSRVLVSEGS